MHIRTHLQIHLRMRAHLSQAEVPEGHVAVSWLAKNAMWRRKVCQRPHGAALLDKRVKSAVETILEFVSTRDCNTVHVWAGPTWSQRCIEDLHQPILSALRVCRSGKKSGCCAACLLRTWALSLTCPNQNPTLRLPETALYQP